MNDWIKLGAQLAEVGLPSLGTLVGGMVMGPLGAGVGGAFGRGAAAAIAQKLNVPATPDAIAAAVAADPADARVKLAEIEADAKTQADFLADVASARSMQVGLAQTGSWIATTPAVLTYIVVGAAIALTFCLFFVNAEIPERVFNLLNQSYGALWLAVGLAVQFWWGSSRTSQQKDQQAFGITAAMTTAAITRR